ncbi:MAG: N-formylglutamate amidohydrolase [Rhodospirillaceae bacterium]|nr:N-formylglutamate amidohydrolase [Rhodospirillaceae bacterium]
MINTLKSNFSSISILKPRIESSACVFSLPHSGREYMPSFIDSSKLDYKILRSSEDFFLDYFFDIAPGYGSSLIKANFPRAFLDLNREPFELDPDMFCEKLPEFINTRSKKVALGLGTIPRVVSNSREIYKNKLKWNDAEKRIENFYFPFHMNLKQLLIKKKSEFGFSVLIDCHSMPSMTQAIIDSRNHMLPDFILGDNFSKSSSKELSSFIEDFLINKGYTVIRNNPYSGGFITQNYGKPLNNIHAIQIEINRSLYMDEQNIEINDGYLLLQKNLKDLIRELSQITKNNFFSKNHNQLAAE